MSRSLKWIACAVFIAVLLGILAVLTLLLLHGLHLEHEGTVSVVGLSDPIHVAISGPIEVCVTDPVTLALSGVETSAIPLEFNITDIPDCPACGGPLLLRSYNLWTGKVEWFCPACNAILTPDP